MRRQEISDRQLSVWAGIEVRPDPFNLPAEYNAPIYGLGACEQDREMVVVSREEVSFSAGRDGVRVPLSQYLGVSMAVAISQCDAEDDRKAATIIILEHENADLNVPLFVAWDSDDVVANWHAWARALGVPLRVRGMDGVSNQINEELGRVAVFPGTPRRMHSSYGAKRKLTRTLRRSSSPLQEPLYANRVEKCELFARQ
ncbi:MAG: DUF6101 family protein [Fimbriimonadaceae bacterium]|nr:DUF6101 family protein [Alphaproteobacteria bacterium]